MSDITMTDPQRFSQTHSDLFGLFQAELARAGAITGFLDAGASLWPRFAACYQGVARLPRKARRALQRRWRRSLGAIALLYALGQAPPALAAQIDVGVDGCTLVDAITAANTNQETNGCPAGSGPDTITLPAGSTQLLTANTEIFSGPNGLPVVRSAIVIKGNGGTIARDPNGVGFRLFAIASTGSLTLQETTVTGGVNTSGGPYSAPGGGILNFGTLVLTNSTVSGNYAVPYFGGGDGGGVFNSGSLTVTDSTISGNSAGGGGGGIVNSSSGTLTLTNSTVSGNSARFGGGGVYTVAVATLANSTVSSNSAGSDGGGLRNDGTLTLTNSTVSGNSAFDDGGGVFNYGGTLTLDQSLVAGNSASSQGLEVFNSANEGSPGTVITNGFNLFGHDGVAGVDGIASGAPGATDLVPAVPLSAILDPALTDNGGPTRTHALVIGSPAIDAVPVVSCVTTADQRGVMRPQDGDEDTVGDCDIGAFELQLPPSTPPLPPPPPLPEATPAQPNPQLKCTGSACRVLIKCDAVQGSVEPCHTRVVIFVRASALRLDDDSAAKAVNRIRFAAGVANIPPGGIANVRLRLTTRGRQIVRANEHRRLRGVMEIRNSIGPVQTVRVRIRIRR